MPTHSAPRILIIGAGVAGLSAGCYARMNGFDTLIVEQHDIPGGLCTSWKRAGYHFDGGLRYLSGTHAGGNSYRMWEELGVLPGQGLYHYDEFICVEDAAGRQFHFFTDIERLEAHMLALSPADARHIRSFTGALRAFCGIDMPLDLTPDNSWENLRLGLSMAPFSRSLLRWRSQRAGDFAAGFKDPLLRSGIMEFLQFSRPDFPMLMLLITLVQLSRKEAAYPIGGSLDLALRMAKRFRQLGGEIRYEARVTEILTEAGRATGVRLADGTTLEADIVISAADGRKTLYEWLGGRYVDPALHRLYHSLPLSPSILFISIGLKRDCMNLPPAWSFSLAAPLDFGDRLQRRLTLRHYAFDPTLAPEGCTMLNVWAETDYGYWQGLHKSRTLYDAEKERIAQAVIAALDARMPGFAAAVEVLDVATPLTFERYTGNHRGAIYGWAMTMEKMAMMMGKGMGHSLKGLEGFYMTGQWVEPAGNVQLSAASARDLIEGICRQADKTFVAFSGEKP